MNQNFPNEREIGLKTISEIRDHIDKNVEYLNFRYEMFTRRFIEVISCAKTFVDAGAEYGFYAYLAVKNMPPDREIHLFEPEPMRYDLLKEFMSPYRRVTVYPQAVAEGGGEIMLYKPISGASCTADSFLSQYRDKEVTPVEFKAETVALDDLFGNMDIDVLKMDIEGAEILALEGMKSILSKGKTRIFIEIHPEYIEGIRQGGLKEFQTAIADYGYRCYHCERDTLTRCAHIGGRAYLVPRGMEP